MKRFNMIDEGFICSVCGARVEPLSYTARNHCPYCLCSLHVDNNPGDRENECNGILRPIGVEKFKAGLKLVFKCARCGQIKRNIAADDDNMDLIIKLSAEPVKHG